MKIRRAAMTGVVVAVALSAALFAQKPDKKQQDAQKKDTAAVEKLAEQMMAGKAQPTDELGLAWVHEDFLKAQDNLEYVPFTVSVDPAKVAKPTLTLYWRVVDAAPAADAANNDKKDDKKNDKPAYEGISFVPKASGAGPMRISRPFAVKAGTYDVYVIAKELPTGEKNEPESKVSVLKHTVTVPDFWSDELTTSSVLIAQRIDPLAAPLTPDQMKDRPYAMGSMEIVPAFEHDFTKQSELSTVMWIYNPKPDENRKPNVTVEYSFYTQKDGSETFFNKTKPTELNAQTLPPQFDLAQGHQLQAGQAVPLASFPEGDYRLEIKVTDNIANTSLSRDVRFTVKAS
jgi:hypothetical protein